MRLTFIGIGSGNPDQLTGEAIRALAQADQVLIPIKSGDRKELAALRDTICDLYLTKSDAKRAYFQMPERDARIADYTLRVDAWHDEIAALWDQSIDPAAQEVIMLVWGDPSLFDSSLRIANRLTARRDITIRVLAGITSLQLLTAAHAIPLNMIGEPVMITTGRKLATSGWPAGVDTLAIMLDGDCAFQTLDPRRVDIWWGAYLGMQDQILIHGPLETAGPQILAQRAKARIERGWIMDIYLLRRR